MILRSAPPSLDRDRRDPAPLATASTGVRMIRWRPSWSDLPLLALALGVVLRLWRWTANWPLWLDEQMVAINIRDRGVTRLLGLLDYDQYAPLGWLWLERAIFDIFGGAERALRLAPVAFGIGTVVVAYLIGRRWLGPVGAFVFVMFCSVNWSMLRYSGEVKQYSADTFFALLLLGLAGWVAEKPTAIKRMATWWAAVAVAAWFSMGSILVVPGCALILVGAAWRSGRWSVAWRFALLGLPWLASLAAHYVLSIRYVVGSSYLNNYWQGLGYPPQSAGPLGLARWVASQTKTLSGNPLYLNAGWDTAPNSLLTLGGALFWLLAVVGMVIAACRRPAFGLLLAAPLVSAYLLAFLRVVPLAERLALWFVPSLFLATAIGVEYGIRALRGWRTRWAAPAHTVRALAIGQSALACAAGAVLIMQLPLTAGAVSSDAATPAIDDRAAVHWLQREHRAGDLVMPITSATMGLEWYDHGGQLKPARMAISVPSGPNCDPDGLAEATRGYDRVLAYGSTRYEPYLNSYAVVGQRLSELGTLVDVQHFGSGASVVYVVDLHGPPSRPANEPGDCVVVS